ncbi:uncharacterized protein LOC131605491 [Vicia villosa]|uniref:uncharacterized protein LOC131605491 n=1 Tax=Vicia villosa TaxID=3911 RepID=UPI00273C86D2|nr:uncharacterized protein LOC131605491 [Vicia villosa]
MNLESQVQNNMATFKAHIMMKEGKIHDQVADILGLSNANLAWDKDSASAHSVFVLRLMHNRIPTDENLTLQGFSFPYKCSICLGSIKTSDHLFFGCQFVANIWNWFRTNLQAFFSINLMAGYFQVLRIYWNSQALVVNKANIIFILYQIWQARNMFRFDKKSTHRKSCISNIAARAKLVGNLTTKKADDSLHSLSFLKSFGINIQPRKHLSAVDVIWCLSARGWSKCNIDGVEVGSTLLAACGGIFRNEQATHLISFSAYLETGTPVLAEFLAAIIAIEKAKQMQWSKLWLETNCILVVKAFSNPNLVSWKIKSRWLTCWAYTLIIEFRISHIFREVIFYADFLDNIGL